MILNLFRHVSIIRIWNIILLLLYDRCPLFSFYSFWGAADDDDGEEEEGEGGYAWLKEREKPEDHVIVGAHYNGPKIVRKWFQSSPFRMFHNVV